MMTSSSTVILRYRLSNDSTGAFFNCSLSKFYAADGNRCTHETGTQRRKQRHDDGNPRNLGESRLLLISSNVPGGNGEHEHCTGEECGEEDVKVSAEECRVGDDGPEVGHHGLSGGPIDLEANGMLHPRVGRQNANS